jgi:NTE family protein
MTSDETRSAPAAKATQVNAPETRDAADGPATSPKARDYEPVYAIFQGGGAKGITHVGALKAMENERLALVGVAGTSAGAIIAALAAVGYRADELLNPKDGTDILKTLGQTLTGVLGRTRWGVLRLLIKWTRPVLAAAVIAFLALIAGQLLAWSWLVSAALILLLAAAVIGTILLVPPILRRGLFRSEVLSNVLNEALRQKLKEHHATLGMEAEVPEWVTFADIDPRKVPLCSPLKVIVSDVRSGRLVLFDQRWPGVVVADAVAASAAIPFAFAPPPVRGAPSDRSPVYADGGLVSNLPSWSFAVEKRALERQQGGQPVPILAFSLKRAAGEGYSLGRLKPMSIGGYVAGVFQTGIFGSQLVVEDFIADLNQIELETPLTTLSFDATRDQINAAHAAGLTFASEALRRRRQTQLLTERLLQGLLERMKEEVEKTRKVGREQLPELRLTIVDPSGPAQRPSSEFRVTASAGVGEGADDRLPLDPRNVAAPQAYAQRKSVFATVHDKTRDTLWMTKYEHALVWPRLYSIISVPIFGRPVREGIQPPEPQRVLCLDSSDSLQEEFNSPTFMEIITAGSLNLSRTLIKEAVA